jgi:hypothetical protein
MSNLSSISRHVTRGTVLRWVCLLLLAGIAVWFGSRLRDASWQATSEIRFRGDIVNAMNQGRAVHQLARRANDIGRQDAASLGWRDWYLDGYLARYPQQFLAHPDGRYDVDYPPLRLLVMSAWMKTLIAEHGTGVQYHDDLVAPLLTFNLAAELLAVVGIFVLVRRVCVRSGRAPATSDWIAIGCAMLAWFNPASILNAHAWPQWDVWVLPFFVWAVYLAVLDRWTLAGVLIALGACLKGQTLLVLPALIAWPLFAGKPARLIALGVGMLGGFVMVGVPWLAPSPTALGWLASLGLATAVMLLTPWPRRSTMVWWVGVLASALPLWAGLERSGFVLAKPAVVAWCVAVLASTMLSPGWRATLWLALLASMTMLVGRELGGSTAWITVGFPTDRYLNLSMGPTINAPALLAYVYGWRIDDLIAGISLRRILQAVAMSLCVGCAIGLARFNNRDRAFLAAVAAPWIVVFAFLPQMHERYLLWGAVLSAMMAAVSTGGLLLHLATTLLATVMTLQQMYNANGGPRGRTLLESIGLTDNGLVQAMNGMHPHAAWGLLVIAFAAMTVALRPTRSRKPDSMSAESTS